MPIVTVAEVREHIAFLREVHIASSHGENSLYTDSLRLRTAVRAYIAWLANEAAHAAGRATKLVTRAPSLDIAWIWHVHRLAPLAYARACAALGAFIAPAPGVGFAYSSGEPSAACVDGQEMEDALVAAVGRHAPFLWQVSGAAYNDHAFLAKAVERYERFVSLSAAEGGLARCCVGSVRRPETREVAWSMHVDRTSGEPGNRPRSKRRWTVRRIGPAPTPAISA